MNDAIRLLLVGDDGMLEAGARALVEGCPEIVITGTTTDVDEAVGICRARPADVVLLDLDLEAIDGCDATERIRSAAPSAKIVVVSSTQPPDAIAAVLAAGACGFVLRGGAGVGIVGVVRRAAAGEMIMPVVDLPHVVGQLHQRRVLAPAPRDGLDRLTVRETEILSSLAEGESTIFIADRLDISRLTVQSHVKSILLKLGVHSKVEAVTLAWRHGLAQVSQSA